MIEKKKIRKLLKGEVNMVIVHIHHINKHLDHPQNQIDVVKLLITFSLKIILNYYYNLNGIMKQKMLLNNIMNF